MIALIIQLVVLCLILGLAWYAINRIPLPAPVKVAAEVAVCIIAIIMLCGLVGWGWHFGVPR